MDLYNKIMEKKNCVITYDEILDTLHEIETYQTVVNNKACFISDKQKWIGTQPCIQIDTYDSNHLLC